MVGWRTAQPSTHTPRAQGTPSSTQPNQAPLLGVANTSVCDRSISATTLSVSHRAVPWTAGGWSRLRCEVQAGRDASASTTTAKTPLRPAQRYSQNSFNVALCNSDSQQRAVIVQQEVVTGLWIRAPARAHASREQPALRQGRTRCRRVGWC